MVSLTAEQAQERFGVPIAIEKLSANLTSEEEQNVAAVLQVHTAAEYSVRR